MTFYLNATKILSDFYITINPKEQLDNVFTKFTELKIRPVLFLDEFQAVFQLDDHQQARRDLAADVCSFARQSVTFAFIAGSSSKLRTMIFRYGDNDPFKGFPDFNGSLFRIFYVPALRSERVLSEYLRQRYPDWNLSEQEVRQLLCCTGGIGRFVHHYYEHTQIEFDCRNHYRRARPIDLLSKGLHIVHSLFALRYQNEIEAHRTDCSLPCVAIDYHQVEAAF